MFQRRLFALVLALSLIGSLPAAARAAEMESGSTYCFSPGDFSGEEGLQGICLTSLPASGPLMLGSRVLRPGDVLTADQVGKMTFSQPGTQEDTAVTVGYLPIFADRVEPETVMTLSIRGKADQPPVAEDLALETYKNLENTGVLKVTDPEGEALTFTVTRQPRRGSVEIRPDGSFTYTPKKNKVGVDSFSFTAADPAGKVSREATVTITILKPTEAPQYTDTLGKPCRFAAEWMKHSGIFVGEQVAENPCFAPEKTVSRGEFVTMLVKALELPVEEDAVFTGYTDEIPLWLKPYLAAALRAGLTAGLPDQQVFGPESPITGAEAAVMLENALDLTASAVSEDGAIPAWAADAVSALAEHGLSLTADAHLTRSDAAQALYRTVKLYGNSVTE